MTANRRIRDRERFEASVRSFQWLGSAMTGATDLDCVMERYGHFLVLEGKTWHERGLQVPLGQHIALLALSHMVQFTVFLVGEVDNYNAPGDKSQVCQFHVMRYGKPAPLTESKHGVFFPSSLFETRDRDGLRSLVTDWRRGVEC